MENGHAEREGKAWQGERRGEKGKEQERRNEERRQSTLVGSGALTESHRPPDQGLKEQKVIFPQFWRLETKTGLSAGLVSSGSQVRWSLSPVSSVSLFFVPDISVPRFPLLMIAVGLDEGPLSWLH